MSESAEDRTKRRFLNLFNLTGWGVQISIFYPNKEESQLHAIKDSKNLRKMLGKAYKDQPWLYRLCLLYRKTKTETRWEDEVDEETGEITEVEVKVQIEIDEPNHIAYHTFFTTENFSIRKFETLKGLLKAQCGCDVTIRRRTLYEAKLDSYARAVKKGRAHNFKKYFGCSPHRYGLINEAALNEPS